MSGFVLTTSTLGMLAGIITFLAYIPYIHGMLNKKTRPDRATWWIWAILGIVIAASYRSSGGIDSSWSPIGNSVGIVAIALLSLKYGEGGYTKLDIGCLIGAAVGIVAWFLTNQPVVALIIATAVDMVGAIPTITKTYYRPEGENMTAWSMFLIGNSINLFAISVWSFAIAFYPVYVFILTLVMVWLIAFHKGKEKTGNREVEKKNRKK